MDEILAKVGYAIEGKFDSVENMPGSVYIEHNGKTYVLSIEECE